MPYAVTCRSCGTQFSVTDGLLSHRTKTPWVVLRCRQCHAPIRVDVSKVQDFPEPPPPPPASSVDNVPRSARARAQREELNAGVNHDLFDAAPPPPLPKRPAPPEADLTEAAVDLSDLAHSEPPASHSSAPPLHSLAKDREVNNVSAGEDVDFLLGFRGSPVPAPLVSPSLTDLARELPAETAAPISARVSDAPASVPVTASSAPQKKHRATAFVAVAVVLLSGGALALRQTNAANSHFQSHLPTQPATRALAAATPIAPVASPAPTEDATVAPAPAAAATAAAPTTAAEPQLVAALTPVRHANKPSRRGDPESSRDTPTSEAESEPEPAVQLKRQAPAGPFDRGAAANALAQASSVAAACRKAGDPSGVANATITFAPSGKVTAALLSGPPFAGTPTGSCIAAALRRVRVPAFEGDRITVAKAIAVR